MSQAPSVAVIIRNLNEGRFLDIVLAALAAQAGPTPEIVVVDNQSDDNSAAIAQKWGAAVVTLPRSDFTYGRALNLGIANARSDLCLILSAHALPLGHDFLGACARPFVGREIAAARCLYAGKAADSDRWMRPEILRKPIDIETIVSKGPLASCCVIRRSVWTEIPFDEEIIAAEEKIWAWDVVNRGYAIYSPCAAPYLYVKKSSPAEAVRKNYREIQAIYQHSGARLGFARNSHRTAMARMFKAILLGAPSAALGAIRVEFLKCRLSFALEWRGRPKTNVSSGVASISPRAPRNGAKDR